MKPGQIIGGYQLVSPIAQGGMGVIWKAQHPSLERWVAIKHIRGDAGDDDSVRQAFVQEVKNLSRLHSPQIVQIIDHGFTEQGDPYMVTEFLEGEDLGQRLQREMSLSVEDTLRIGIEILKALSEAHAIGLVHRDLKPGNIFLQKLAGESREAVKVLDFGVAKLLSDSVSPNLDPSMGAKGSPRFMAPEQVVRDPVTTAADIYSFGATLYRMLSGSYVFGGTPVEVLQQHLGSHPEPLSQRNPDAHCPEELEDLIMVCLRKNPEERPISADALLARMEWLFTQHKGGDDSLRPEHKEPSVDTAQMDESHDGLPSWLESASGIRALTQSFNAGQDQENSRRAEGSFVSAFGDDPFASMPESTRPPLGESGPDEPLQPARLDAATFDASSTVEEAQPIEMLKALRSDQMPVLDIPDLELEPIGQPVSEAEGPVEVSGPPQHETAQGVTGGVDFKERLARLVSRWKAPSNPLLLPILGTLCLLLTVVYFIWSGEQSQPPPSVDDRSHTADTDRPPHSSDWVDEQTRKMEQEGREKAERNKMRAERDAKRRKNAPKIVRVQVAHGPADFIRVIDGKSICRRQLFCRLGIDQPVRVERPGFKPRILSTSQLKQFVGTERTIRLDPR